MALWSVCRRCGKPFSVDVKYCPSCLREKYKAELVTTRSSPGYPLDMQYCKGGYKVLQCQGDINNSCGKYGFYSCVNEEKTNCPCRACCAGVHREYVDLSQNRQKENRDRVFETVGEKEFG